MNPELKNLIKRRENAIEDVKLNCKRLRNFMKYGVESFSDRIPSTSTSIMKQPSGYKINSDIIYINALDEELQDKLFIEKMIVLFANLKSPYDEVFKKHYIEGRKLKDIKRSNNSNILSRGYIQLALLDGDISWNYNDELKYNDILDGHDATTNKIIREMKARLRVLRSYHLSKMICIFHDDKGVLHIENIRLGDKEFEFLEKLIDWINQLEGLSFASTMSPKEAVYKYIMDTNWKYLDTANRTSLLKGLLALAYLDEDIPYDKEDIEFDAIHKCRSNSFVKELRNFQLILPLGFDHE